MRLKIAKKIKTVSLNSMFTGSKKNLYLNLYTFGKC